MGRISAMRLKDKILDASLPVKLFELVPPAADKPEAIDAAVAGLGSVAALADAVNLPEIHDESQSRGPRTVKFMPRIEPRMLGRRIRNEAGMEVVVNRCVVYEPDQLRWLEETGRDYGIENVVLVGGESSQIQYPGPGVTKAAEQARAAGFDACLGGITIPSRRDEAGRIRRKHQSGLSFFTTQILFDSNDVVWLIQQLNGVEARIFLSFAPVSHPRDLQLLRWLGADIPEHLDRFLLRDEGGDRGASPAGRSKSEPPDSEIYSPSYLHRSLDLAQRILMDVFDNLPPDPPPLGLNVEHINQRNFQPALTMLEHLGGLYNRLVTSHLRTATRFGLG